MAKIAVSELCKWEDTTDGRLVMPKGEGYVTGHTKLGWVEYTFVATAKGHAYMIPSEMISAR